MNWNKNVLLSALLIATLLVSACSAAPTPAAPPSALTASPTQTSAPQPESTAGPAITPGTERTATSIVTDTTPFHLTTVQLSQLGSPTAPFVERRLVVIQRFEKGVMLIFAKPGNVFENRGGDFIFALAGDRRAWRVRDTFVETSKNPDDWYTCERKPGLRPERSGIPWRGFGKVWCENPEVRSALGFAKTYEDSDIEASYQSYERGRALQVSDWKGYPGWKNGQVYVVYYSSLENPDLVSATWE